MVSACDFCDELSGGNANAFSKIYGSELGSRVLFHSDGFTVVPSIGQINEGYLLIVPVSHVMALGDLQVSSLNALVRLTERVGKALAETYGPCIFFEHGTRSEGVGGCGIYHAHLHAIPLGEIVDPIDELRSRFDYTKLPSMCDVGKESLGLSTYLFYRDSNAQSYLFRTGPLPSQFMRGLIADLLGGCEWNWRSFGKEERLLSVVQHLKSQLCDPQGLRAHAPKHH